MSLTLSIPSDVLERAIAEAVSSVVKAGAEDLQMLDAKQASELLKITPQAFRKLAGDSFDFGQRRARWSLRELRELVETRRVKATRSKP